MHSSVSHGICPPHCRNVAKPTTAHPTSLDGGLCVFKPTLVDPHARWNGPHLYDTASGPPGEPQPPNPLTTTYPRITLPNPRSSATTVAAHGPKPAPGHPHPTLAPRLLLFALLVCRLPLCCPPTRRTQINNEYIQTCRTCRTARTPLVPRETTTHTKQHKMTQK